MSRFQFLVFLYYTLELVHANGGMHAIVGKVGAGNYSYYVLKYEGPILLELESLEGDADIYVSDKVEHPSFDLEEHSLSSWTCGTDKVFIPKQGFGRPVNIAVYGHPRFDLSHYVLTAEFLSNEDIEEYDGEFHVPNHHHDAKDEKEDKSNLKDSLGPDADSKVKKMS